jgi:beta-barrel assembly-enhancing protease
MSLRNCFISGVLLLGAVPAFCQRGINPPTPRWNLFSKQQDIQMGREAASQVQREHVVIRDPEITNYLTALGAKLAHTKYSGDFPFSFSLVADETINAFALPGGPMFVHTGLIKAADNEGELVGVLAHEMSHVVLRHGTHQASRENALQLPAALASAVLGGSLLGQLGMMIGGLGESSLLLKFSRTAEAEADYNGVLMMDAAGYNPMEMAHFFEKLAAKSGNQGVVSRMMSDHPAPENRVKAAENLVRLLPKHAYNTDNTAFLREQQLVAGMRNQPRPGPANGGQPAQISDLRPSSQLRPFAHNTHNFQFPSNWEAFGSEQSPSVTVAPRGGIGKNQQGGAVVAYGIMQSYYEPQNGSADLRRDTAALIQSMAQNDGSIRVGDQQSMSIDGRPALAIMLQAASAFRGETEVDLVVTTERPQGLFFLVLIAPKSEWNAVQPVYQEVIRSIHFNN